MSISIKDRYDILRNSPNLMQMEHAILEELAKHSGQLMLQTGEKMLFNYENQHSVYIIVSGKISFVLENHITGKQAIDEFETGSLVGHFNSRLSVKGDISLVATETTVLLSIKDKILSPLLAQSPSAQFQFDKTLRNIIHRGQLATYMSRLFDLHDPVGFKKLLSGIVWRSTLPPGGLYKFNLFNPIRKDASHHR